MSGKMSESQSLLLQELQQKLAEGKYEEITKKADRIKSIIRSIKSRDFFELLGSAYLKQGKDLAIIDFFANYAPLFKGNYTRELTLQFFQSCYRTKKWQEIYEFRLGWDAGRHLGIWNPENYGLHLVVGYANLQYGLSCFWGKEKQQQFDYCAENAFRMLGSAHSILLKNLYIDARHFRDPLLDDPDINAFAGDALANLIFAQWKMKRAEKEPKFSEKNQEYLSEAFRLIDQAKKCALPMSDEELELKIKEQLRPDKLEALKKELAPPDSATVSEGSIRGESSGAGSSSLSAFTVFESFEKSERLRLDKEIAEVETILLNLRAKRESLSSDLEML